ncbi:hypothetical protein, partial [Pseudomonas amygdali]|uniref:hypothetical protein n=1 Tax=Pseudomonas amygdali TaxID=47877 RepID=UPI001C80090B
MPDLLAYTGKYDAMALYPVRQKVLIKDSRIALVFQNCLKNDHKALDGTPCWAILKPLTGHHSPNDSPVKVPKEALQ